MARPTKYDKKRHPAIVAALAAAGKTDVEICGLMGMARSTMQSWREKHPEFDDALKSGKEPVDDSVQASLLKRALGFEYEETEMVGEPGADGKILPLRMRKVKKLVVPDVTACIFWLKNRRPAEWRDRKDVEANLTFNSFAEAMRAFAAEEAVGVGTGE